MLVIILPVNSLWALSLSIAGAISQWLVPEQNSRKLTRDYKKYYLEITWNHPISGLKVCWAP